MRGNFYKYVVGILGIIYIGILMVFYVPNIKLTGVEEISRLEGWVCKHSDGSEEQAELPQRLYSQNENRTSIYTELPEAFTDRQIVCFWTYSQSVEVYLDSEKIYSYGGPGENNFGKAPASTWHYVDMPEHSDGKTLKITTGYPYENCFYKMDEVVYGTSGELYQWMNYTYGLNQLLDWVFIIVGALFIILAIVQKVDQRNKASQFYLGIMAFMLGVCLRISVKGIPVYGIGNYLKALLGYVAFFIIAISFACYVKSRVNQRPKLVMICQGVIIGELIAAIAVFALQGLGKCDIHEIIWIGHVFWILSILLALFIAVYYYVKNEKATSIYTLISTLILAVTVLFSYVQMYYLNRNILKLGTIFRMTLLIVIVLEITIYITNLKMITRYQKQMEEENEKLQFQIFNSQIRPHFILNTLGAIRTMILKDANQAYDLLYDFSKYIRKNIEEKDYKKLIPFPEELDYIETYIKLEQARFGERLHVEYDIEEKEFWVLPLSIQPFVENAVKHGVYAAKHGGTVWISTKKTTKGILIEIKDNGVGFDVKKVEKKLKEGKSVGMRSALFRIKAGMNGKCTIESSMKTGNSGTTVSIIIPQQEVKNENNNSR